MPYSYKERADFLPENATNWHQGASLTLCMGWFAGCIVTKCFEVTYGTH